MTAEGMAWGVMVRDARVASSVSPGVTQFNRTGGCLTAPNRPHVPQRLDYNQHRAHGWR